MPARRRFLGLASAVVALAVLATAALAASVKEVTDLAATYQMACDPPTATDVTCNRGILRASPFVLQAVVSPASGPVVNLLTRATYNGTPAPATGTDALTRQWASDLLSLACGDPKGVAAYVNLVHSLTSPGFGPPQTIGICQFNGGFGNITLPTGAPGVRWTIGASVIPPATPSPTPKVTPPPTPKPTPVPTPKPTAKPTPKPTPPPTPTPAITAAPTATPTAAATAVVSAAPSPSESTAPSPTAPATVVPVDVTPSPAIVGETPAPAPTPAATEGSGPGATPEPSQPAWEESVLGIQDVSADGGAIGGSLLLALLLLLIIGFIGELFNNTVENNYDEIAGWFQKGPIGRLRRARGGIRIDPPGRPGVLVFIALTALISAFVDPSFGLNVRSIAVFLGFLVGLIVVLASFKLPPILARRRRTGEMGQLRPLPWALVIAAMFVLATRLAHLQPGYLYGIVLGAIFVSDATTRDEGRETFWGLVWTLAAAVLGWVALTWLRGLGLPQDGFGVTLLSTAFAATMVAGLEAAAFALMPLRFLPGYVLYKWNRPIWAVLWAVSLFAFFHILIGPTSGYVSELSPQAFLAALGVFAAFGAVSIGTWLYFRFRHPPLPEAAEA